MASPAHIPSTCPRCGASADHPSECVRCGVVFAKFELVRARRPAGAAHAAEPGPSAMREVDGLPPAADTVRLVEPAFDPSQRAHVAGRAIVWGGLAAWTVAFASHSIESNHAGESFLHLVNLVFHEAGHVVFAPFGQFMTVAGGSLLQVLVPLACVVAFARAHNPFGATVGTWWAGQSLVDLAPYIDDARALQLVLLGGRTGAEVEGHDWEYLLGTLGLLHRDHALARAAHVIGLVVMGLALCWGAAVLWRQWRATSALAGPPEH